MSPTTSTCLPGASSSCRHEDFGVSSLDPVAVAVIRPRNVCSTSEPHATSSTEAAKAITTPPNRPPRIGAAYDDRQRVPVVASCQGDLEPHVRAAASVYVATSGNALVVVGTATGARAGRAALRRRRIPGRSTACHEA